MAELTTLQLALIDINLQLSDAVNKSTKSVYFLPNKIQIRFSVKSKRLCLQGRLQKC